MLGRTTVLLLVFALLCDLLYLRLCISMAEADAAQARQALNQMTEIAILDGYRASTVLLAVETVPPGLPVQLAGRPVGTSPIEDLPLHRLVPDTRAVILRIDGPDGTPWFGHLTTEAGSQARVVHRLQLRFTGSGTEDPARVLARFAPGRGSSSWRGYWESTEYRESDPDQHPEARLEGLAEALWAAAPVRVGVLRTSIVNRYRDGRVVSTRATTLQDGSAGARTRREVGDGLDYTVLDVVRDLDPEARPLSPEPALLAALPLPGRTRSGLRDALGSTFLGGLEGAPPGGGTFDPAEDEGAF